MSPISREAFRDAMAGMAAAVCIVTTDGPGGRYGMTVTACCSVSDDPPIMLVCLNRASQATERFKQNGRLALNVLAVGHESLADRFARRMPGGQEDRFATMPWCTSAVRSGSPVLPEALVSLWGSIVGMAHIGTHTVFYVQVEGRSARAAADPMIYYDRGYRGLLHLPGLENSRRMATQLVRLEGADLSRRLTAMPDWSLREGKLCRHFVFDSFEQALAFMNLSAQAASKLDHHPSWVNDHARVDVRLSTLDVQGISWLDFELAAWMNQAFQAVKGDMPCAA